jgi:hypothetical protein
MLIGHVPDALFPVVFALVPRPVFTQDCNAHELAAVPPSCVALPLRFAVMVPAEKLPFASRITILFAVFADVAPISTAVHVTPPLPFTDFPVSPIVIVLDVPQLAVVMSEPPLKDVPLMFLAVVRVAADVAVVALVAVVAVVAVAAFPVILMGHVPDALFPVVFALPLSPVVTQDCNAHKLAAVPPRELAFDAVVAVEAFPFRVPLNVVAVTLEKVAPPDTHMFAAEMPVTNVCNPVNDCAPQVTAMQPTSPVFPLMEATVFCVMYENALAPLTRPSCPAATAPRTTL